MSGLTPYRVVHEFTIPQLAALAEEGPRTTSDPFALRPGERVLSGPELQARLDERRRQRDANKSRP